jgi:hypothetical protein
VDVTPTGSGIVEIASTTYTAKNTAWQSQDKIVSLSNPTSLLEKNISQ